MNKNVNSSLFNQTYCTPPSTFIDNYLEFSHILAFYGFTFFVGIIGNLLIIYTVAHFQRIRTLPNMFLVNLAYADLLLIIVCVPIKFVQLFSFTWQFGKFLCKMVHYIQNVSAICSVYTLTVISIERYFGILYPVQSRAFCSKQKRRWFIIAIWIASLIMAQPVVYIRIMYPVNCNAYYCIPDYDSYWIGYYETYMLILILVFPTIILCYTYTIICYRLRTVLKKRNLLTTVPLENNDIKVELNDLHPLQNNDADRVNSFDSENEINSEKIETSHSQQPNLNKFKFSKKSSKTKLKNILNFILLNKNDKFNKSNKIKLNLYTQKETNLDCNQAVQDSCISNKQNLNQEFDLKSTCSSNKNEVKNSIKKFKTTLENRSFKKNYNLQRNCNDRNNGNNVKQVIKLLVAVVILFIICWTPVLVFNLLKGLGIISRFNYGILRSISIYFHLLSYVNSAINPIIYGFMSRHFRNSFRAIFTSIFYFKSSKYSKHNQSTLVLHQVPSLVRKNTGLYPSNK